MCSNYNFNNTFLYHYESIIYKNKSYLARKIFYDDLAEDAILAYFWYRDTSQRDIASQVWLAAQPSSLK